MWGQFSTLLADLNCMTDLLKHPAPWRYVINLCGMDFPLKTNLEIVRQLKAYKNHNCIEGYIPPMKPHGYRYTSTLTHQFKPPTPHNITVYKGDTFIAATRAFVNFTMNDDVSKDFLTWLEDVHIPDEKFTSSLNRLPNAPGGSTKPSKECNVRFRKWDHNLKFPERPKCIGIFVHRLCIFSAGYLQYLRATPELFVNKLHYVYDPVALQCLEESLHHRTYHPEAYKQWGNFPVTNFSWIESVDSY